jgi:Flp pilus assembly protein TadG
MRRLRAAQGGTATIEFALISVFFFGAVMVGLDFAAYTQVKLRLGQAVEQGAIQAFNTRDTVDVSAIKAYVRAVGGLTADPTVTCNNNAACAAASSRASNDYRCVNQTTGAIDSTAQSAGASCSGGGNAGYYLKITATKSYTPLIVSDQWFGGSSITQSAVVRLS